VTGRRGEKCSWCSGHGGAISKTRDTAERRVDASSCGVEGALKGIGSATKRGCRIIKCLFDIFNDLHGENQIAQGHREDQLEHTRIEGFVGVNDEDDDVLDRCQSGSGDRSVKYELWVGLWTHAVSGHVYRGEAGFLELFVLVQRHPTRHRDGHGGCSLGGETLNDRPFSHRIHCHLT